MNARAHRLSKLRDVLHASHPHSQEEISHLLHREGVDATQATLSRDLRELGVLKGPDGYVLPDAPQQQPAQGGRALARMLRGVMVEARAAGTLVVVRTGVGHAPALALEVDKSALAGVVGSVAGDDTIFLATPSPRAATRVARVLMDMLRNA